VTRTRLVANPTAPTGIRAAARLNQRQRLALIAYCQHNPDSAQRCKVSKCPCCEGLGVAALCPNCAGTGAIATRTLREAQLAHVPTTERCEVCKGIGYIAITEELLSRLGFRKDPQACAAND